MRLLIFPAILLVAAHAAAETPAGAMWSELKAKRDKVPSFHQEFEVVRISITVDGSRSLKRKVWLDVSPGFWLEKSLSGSGNHTRVFDGNDILTMEEGGDEYVRTKSRANEEKPQPAPYGNESDWADAVEKDRLSCGIVGKDHQCVVLEAPMKPWMHAGTGSHFTKLVHGEVRVSIDLETGLLITSESDELIDNGRRTYRTHTTYVLKRMSHGAPADANLFKLPSGDMREVKELSKWNATKIKEQLVGKPAPELAVTDLKGEVVTLSALKGKTVLLDFWATWCQPCRADGPSLEKLYRKYGDKDLVIVGVSVSEDRAVVEKFLGQFPHSFPIVLTSENDLPRPYQISVFPTYIVINRDGELTAAVEGDKGFAGLRRLLKKAALES